MKNTNKYLSLAALSLAGGCIYQLPYIKYILYDQQLTAMGITNQQSGLLLTFYGIGNMILYIPGGIVTDRFSPKILILISLTSTSVIAFIHAFTVQVYSVSLIIWLLLSITTTFLFWTALLKAVGMVGTKEEQGRMYGFYYAGNGISLALANALALWASTLTTDLILSYRYAVIVCAVVLAVASISVFFLFRENKETNETVTEEEKFHLSHVLTVLKNPMVWIFSIIVFCSYALFSNLSYLTPYLTNVIGVSSEASGVFSIIRQNMALLLAPIGGYLADKFFKSTSKFFTFAFSAVAVTIFGILLIPAGTNAYVIGSYTLLIGALVMMAYGIQFSIMSEIKIPVRLTGTAVGIASVIGYSPDFFMSTLFGYWLDKSGDEAYYPIFIFLASLAALAVVLSFIVRKYSIKMQRKTDQK